VTWPDLEEWWLGEIGDDPAYEEVLTPLLVEVLQPEPDKLYLDLGCGEGRVMRALTRLGARVVGLDVNEGLARAASPAVVARLPGIPLQAASVDGVYAVVVLEHLEELGVFFRETARVSRTGGVMAVVMNHPTWTAPGSTPISDTEGETLWRPGDYFGEGSTEVAAGEGRVVFHHRTLGDLLTAAADAGWALQRMLERPHHEMPRAPGVPRLLACRWLLPLTAG
jgi:SAM-dependent methyltransferase